MALILAAAVPPLPGILVAYGRHAAAWSGHAGEIVYVGEGMHASIAISKTADGLLNYHNAGRFRRPASRGHAAAAHARPPHDAAAGDAEIGARDRLRRRRDCGSGERRPAVDRVTIVEIEPLVPKVARHISWSDNYDVLGNPKVRVIIDDARHYLQTTTEKFDAITSDPLDPWVKGAATLYTREFFETARQHLNPGGVMTLYVQLFESSPEAVKSEVATFFEAFPEGLIFGNVFEGHAIDTVLVGQAERPEIGWTRLRPRCDRRRLPRSTIAGAGWPLRRGGTARQLRGARATWAGGWPTPRSIAIRICACSISPGSG